MNMVSPFLSTETSHRESLRCFSHFKFPSLSKQYRYSSPHPTTKEPFFEIPEPTIALFVGYSQTCKPPSVNIQIESPVPIAIFCPLGSADNDHIDFPIVCSHSIFPIELNIRSLQSLPPHITLLPLPIIANPCMPSSICFSHITEPVLSTSVRFPFRSPTAIRLPSSEHAIHITGPAISKLKIESLSMVLSL